MSVIVRLAGYNVDADLLRETVELVRLVEGAAGGDSDKPLAQRDGEDLLAAAAERIRRGITPDAFTPETVSAAYARISRDPKPVTELRRAARFGVARARKSNESIIFGLGHASVAEHACFNFDIIGLSRLASEELQAHRLASFTEKSQRYITISADYVVPAELVGSVWEPKYRAVIEQLFAAYDDLAGRLVKRYLPAGETDKNIIRDAETKAKEDARYLLPLACCTQMGMTVNARGAEHIICDFSDHPLAELRDLGRGLAQAIGNLAPSLVKYMDRGRYPRENRRRLREVLSSTNGHGTSNPEHRQGPEVRLVSHSEDGEERVLRTIAFSCGLTEIPAQEKREILWKLIFENMGPHDSALRELELPSMTFEAIVSASCFAQLKRHRLLTLLSQPYDPDLGGIIPPSLVEAGLEEEFWRAWEESTAIARELRRENPLLAPYLLTNAQRRRVLIHLNARELYHVARLRSDRHAQWEIRELSDQMLQQAKGVWPNLLAMACGKDVFADIYRASYE